MFDFLRNQKGASWETAKFFLRMVIFYAPLILALITDIQGEGIWFAVSTVIAGADKWKFESSDDNKGIVQF